MRKRLGEQEITVEKKEVKTYLGGWGKEKKKKRNPRKMASVVRLCRGNSFQLKKLRWALVYSLIGSRQREESYGPGEGGPLSR